MEGVGLDALYDEIDPFDVSLGARQPGFVWFSCLLKHPLCGHTSILNARSFSSIGLSGFTRWVTPAICIVSCFIFCLQTDKV